MSTFSRLFVGSPNLFGHAAVTPVPIVTNTTLTALTTPIAATPPIALPPLIPATNVPTSWAITATSPSQPTWFTIAPSGGAGSGQVSLTAAGKTGMNAAGTGSESLTVTASNAGGTSAPGTATVGFSPASSFPDGSVSSPINGAPAPVTDPSQPLYSTVTSRNSGLTISTFLNKYHNASTPDGRYRNGDPTDGKQYQPPWKVSGVDYPVGINASALPLKVVTTGNAATFFPAPNQVDTVTGVIKINVDNLVIDGFDFSQGPGWFVWIGDNGSTGRNVKVQNCYWKCNQHMCQVADGTITNNFGVPISQCACVMDWFDRPTVQYCVFDLNGENIRFFCGDNSNHNVFIEAYTGNPSSSVSGQPALTFQYNWVYNGVSEFITGGAGINTPNTNTLGQDIRFNAFGTVNIGVGTPPDTALHGDYIQDTSDTDCNCAFNWSWNFHYADIFSTTAITINWFTQGLSMYTAGTHAGTILGLTSSNNTWANPVPITPQRNPGDNYSIGNGYLLTNKGFMRSFLTGQNNFASRLLQASGVYWVDNGNGSQNPTVTINNNTAMETATFF